MQLSLNILLGAKNEAVRPTVAPSQPARGAGPVKQDEGSKKEKELMVMMMDLGISQNDAKESLFATNYMSVEAALEYLYSR